MATQAQVLANRLNAQKSTGPRTTEGKEIVSQNAVKHGLLAQKAVIVGEDPGEFEFYRGEMLGELAPAGGMESMLAERVVSLSWRLRRAERVQNEAFDALLAKDTASPLARLTQSLMPKGPDRPGSDFGAGEDDSGLGRVVVKDFSGGRVLDRLLMYERRIEHSLYRTMTELQRLRLMRELDPPTENPTRQGERWGKPQPTTPTPAMEQPTREGERWGKPQPTTPTPAMEQPTRAGERWGKPQPTIPTPAMEQPTRQGERWGEPQPTDTSRAVGNPTPQGKCWGKPQPTDPARAMGKPKRQPACAGGDLPRQTKPMARERDVESPARRESGAGCAKQSQFAGARLPAPPSGGQACGVSGNDRNAREAGCAKRTQSAEARLLRRCASGNDSKGRGADCAKQSQWAEPVGAVPEDDCAKQSQFGGVRMNHRRGKGVCEPTQSMPNKPNSQGRGYAAALCCGGHGKEWL